METGAMLEPSLSSLVLPRAMKAWRVFTTMLSEEQSRQSKIMHKRDLVVLVLGLGFLGACAILIIGNYENRLASVHGDNGPVFYAYLYTHAGEFLADPFGAPGLHWIWGSICFWLPVLANKYVGLDPRFLDYLFYFLQTVLLGLAVFLLTREVSRSWLIAFASMALAIAIQPWSWNLAAYPMPLSVPLYTTLAEGLATLAGAAFLTSRWNLAWLLAVVTALVHPIIACYLLAMLAAWACLELADYRKWLSPYVLGKLGLLIILCGAPLLLPLGFTEPLLSPAEHWVSISKHMHSVPWGNYPPVFHDLAADAAGFVAMLACCWRPLMAFPRDHKRFLVAAAAGTVMLSMLQIAGVELKIGNIALTMGLRSVSNFILFSWPFVFSVLFSRDILGRVHTSFALILLALVWYGMGGGIPVLHILLFAMVLNWPDTSYPKKRLFYVAILALLPLALISMGKTQGIFWRADREIALGYYLLAILLSAVGADLLSTRRVTEPLRGVIALGLVIFALNRSYGAGAEARTVAAADMRAAEIWARDHTPPGTMFMTAYNWRSIAHRPAAPLVPLLSQEVYTPFRSLRNYDDMLLQLYGIQSKWRSMGIMEINNAASAAYARLTQRDFVEFSDKIGASYFVRSTVEPAMNFPIAYRNSTFVIYRLHGAVSNGHN